MSTYHYRGRVVLLDAMLCVIPFKTGRVRTPLAAVSMNQLLPPMVIIPRAVDIAL